MKKGLKKCIAVIMVILMTAVYMPVTDISELFTLEASAITNGNVSLGGNVKWSYDKNSKTITVSGSGNMKNFNNGDDGQRWDELVLGSIHYPNKDAEKIVINNGITNIGNNAFKGLTGVKSVTIPASVTSIGTSAFEGCTSLTSATLPANLKSIGANAFKNTKVANVTLPDSLTSISSNSFSGVSGVKFTCNYGTYAYNYCVNNNCTFSFPQNKLLVAASLDSANKQVVVNLKMLYNRANFNAGNFNLTYSSAVTPASTETVYDSKDGVATGIVFNEGKVSVAVMAQTFVPYSSTKGACVYDFGEIRFNVNSQADTASFNFAYEVLMMNDSKTSINGASAEIGLHSYKDVVVTASTCKTPGTKNTVCEICGIGTPSDLPIDKNNHQGGTTVVNAKEPGCNEKGFSGDTVCDDCGVTIAKGSDVPATGNHDYEKTVTAPTCKDKGFTTYTCKVCKTSYTADETPVAAHDYEKTVTAPTCQAEGFTTYTCKVCKTSYTADETPVAAHDYEKTVTAPTCQAEGFTTYKCKNCDDSYVGDKTPVAAHDYNKVVTEPTCTEGGFTVYTCKFCEETNTADITEQLGHDFDESGKCSRCDATADVSLKFSDEKIYVVNEETKVVYIKKSANSEEVLADIVSGNWVINNADGNAVAEGKLVVTGNVIKAANSDLAYTIAVFGDVNRDGRVNALDARAVLRVSAQLDEKTEVILLAGDCDGKAGITAMDARIILRVGAQIQTF